MAELTYGAVYGALVRACKGHCLPDPLLTGRQASAILDVIESLAEPAEMEIHGEAFVSAAVTPQELRVKSYEIAIESGHSHDQSNLHQFAAQIEENIRNGWTRESEAKAETMTFRVKIDTSEFDAVLAQFGRTEFRREAWNDCKAVMIRVLNQQIGDPNSDNFVLKLKKQQLENVRDFVASFEFDPDMP